MSICPKCHSKLYKVYYQNIEVDRCIKCEGIWFDATEAEELKKLRGSENIDIGNPEIGDRYNRIQQLIKCPRCQGKMQKMLDIDRHSIWYEQCTQCLGIWLDAGEFKKFKQNFQPHNLMNLTQIIFR